ncbi:MAG TPA: transporter substrate-binding domain-containing protein [Thermoanaerobaculia bacterium]|jgi:ABC-type amino acid transport substrate-binding protein|nr:transporter substrate-binding domain-containing protein [Thermoanaerobaculia bacterium]
MRTGRAGGVLLLATALAAGIAGSRAEAAAAETARTGSPLRVLAYDTRPFFYHDGGKPAGLEYEILDYYARAKGRPLQIVWVDDFEEVIGRLAKGDGDVAAATLTATPERRQQVDFSARYFPVRVMLVEPRGQNTTSLSDIAGATLATIKGTTYETVMMQVPHAKFVYGITEDDMLKLIASGKARAAAADSALVLGPLRNYPQLKLGIPLSPEQGLAFAVPKGSPLGEDLSKHIAQLKAGQIYYRLLEKHLGTEAARLAAAGREK